jgi:DNA polymerase III subunit alpha
MSYCHLHVHTEYSQLDGFGTANDYVRKANELGFKYLGCTDHGNIDGTIKFQKICLSNNIKPILGCELYIVDNLYMKVDKEKRGHIVVLAKNATGWNNLTKMLTIANIEGFYKKPRVDYNTYLEHSDGIVTLSACASSFVNDKNGLKLLEGLIDRNRDVYLEIMPINYKEQQEQNKLVIKLAKKYSLPIVASNDCHYPLKEDAEFQEVLLAIQTRAKWNDKKRWRFSTTDLYLKSENEMLDSFKANHAYIDKNILSDAMSNSVKIAEECNFTINRSKVFLPNLIIDDKITPTEYLTRLCKEGMYNKIISKGIDSGQYRKRMINEIKILDQKSFISYFLIIQDIVRWCKNNNVFVGPGRGSASGSLVAYLLDITDVDPIKHKLIFERFISQDRADLPDIDIDFEDKKRDVVRKYIEEKYGEFNTASVSTFLQMKSKMVFKDVCRVFDLPFKLVNDLSKLIEIKITPQYQSNERSDTSISEFKRIFSEVKECILFKKKYPKIIDICAKLEGQVRGTGKHAAAIIITKDDLRTSDRCNLTNRNGVLTVNWEKKDAEYVGMLKVDVLGLSNLSIMNHFKELVKTNHDIDVNFIEDVDLEDKEVLKEFAEGNCVGIFQFGTYGLRKLCRKLKIDSFELLTHTTAIYRPATLQSGLVDDFIESRFSGKRKTDSKFQDVLKDTYGLMIYQEQVMQVVNELANLSFVDADKIRKLLDSLDRESLTQYRLPFINGCIANKMARGQAKICWEELIKYGGYSFNKSHATAYTMLSFWNMWAKHYFPVEFMCASLTFSSSAEKKEELFDECERMGVKMISPKILHSDPIKWVGKNGRIYVPFIEIKGIGEQYAEKISKIKMPNKQGFYEVNDFSGSINARLFGILNKVEAFDDNDRFCICDLISFKGVKNTKRKYY